MAYQQYDPGSFGHLGFVPVSWDQVGKAGVNGALDFIAQSLVFLADQGTCGAWCGQKMTNFLSVVPRFEIQPRYAAIQTIVPMTIGIAAVAVGDVEGVAGADVGKVGFDAAGTEVLDTAIGDTATAAPVDTAGSIRNVNVRGGTNNCVGCAIAADATLGGSPASAVGGGPYPVSDILQNFPGASFVPANGYSGVQTMVSSWGPGSRGIVWGTRAGGVPGHVFNVANQAGVIRFLDAQSGTAAVLEDFDALFILRTR
jgi:hypothetical protein